MMPFGLSLPFRTSLPAKLALFALVFIAAVACVHVLSRDRLVHVSEMSSEVRNRWLDSIRYLTHIDQRISDVRTAEVDTLLSRDPAWREARAAELPRLLEEATKVINQYEMLPLDAEETAVFKAFVRNWAEHADHAQAVISLLQTGQVDAATLCWRGPLRRLTEPQETSSAASAI